MKDASLIWTLSEKQNSKWCSNSLPLKSCFWGVLQERKYRDYPEFFHKKSICQGCSISNPLRKL